MLVRVGRCGLKLGDGAAEGVQNFGDFLCAFVFGARPEEALKSIAFAARHDVHVKMRNALADAIVKGHESTLGVHATLDSNGQYLNVGEEGRDQRGGQIGQSFEMIFRDEQTMPGEQRAVIEKRQGVLILEDFGSGSGTLNDFAEQAAFLECER